MDTCTPVYSSTSRRIRFSPAVGACAEIPVVVCGGAGSISDFEAALTTGKASGAAAGSFFVYHGKHRGVLISYPSPIEMKKIRQLPH